MDKIAGALIRVSTHRQLDNTSPEHQKAEIFSASRKHGYLIPKEFMWITAESGFSIEREGFELIKSAVKTGDISRVYVYSVDRLARSLRVMLNFVAELEAVGVTVFSVVQNQQLKSSDELFILSGLFSEKEREFFLRRSRDGLLANAKNGLYCGGIIPYGYKVEKQSKQFVIDDDEAQVIRFIYKLCLNQNTSTLKIAEILNEKSIPTRYQKLSVGKREKNHQFRWSQGRVLAILKNPFYKGLWQYGKRGRYRLGEKNQIIESSVPAIIDDKLWEDCQICLQTRKLFIPTKSPQKRKYLLKSLITCGYCGRAYCGSVSYVATGIKRYYKCTRRTFRRVGDSERCFESPSSIIAEEIEDQIWNRILFHLENRYTLIQNLCKEFNNPTDAKKHDVERLRRSLDDLEKEEINLISLQIKLERPNFKLIDALSTDINVKRSELEKQVNEIENSSQNYDSKLELIREYEKLLEKLSMNAFFCSWDQKRKIIIDMVKCINVFQDRFEVYYSISNHPHRKSPLSNSADIFVHTDRDS